MTDLDEAIEVVANLANRTHTPTIADGIRIGAHAVRRALEEVFEKKVVLNIGGDSPADEMFGTRREGLENLAATLADKDRDSPIPHSEIDFASLKFEDKTHLDDDESRTLTQMAFFIWGDHWHGSNTSWLQIADLPRKGFAIYATEAGRPLVVIDPRWLTPGSFTGDGPGARQFTAILLALPSANAKHILNLSLERLFGFASSVNRKESEYKGELDKEYARKELDLASGFADKVEQAHATALERTLKAERNSINRCLVAESECNEKVLLAEAEVRDMKIWCETVRERASADARQILEDQVVLERDIDSVLESIMETL